MRHMKWIGLAAALLLIVSCFTPWVVIESKNITISGIDATGTNFGKPAYFHFMWTGLCLAFLFFNRLWSSRAALVFSGFNMAWAIRNFFLLSACQMGDCPAKKIGLYLVFFGSMLLFLSIMLIPTRQKDSV